MDTTRSKQEQREPADKPGKDQALREHLRRYRITTPGVLLGRGHGLFASEPEMRAALGRLAGQITGPLPFPGDAIGDGDDEGAGSYFMGCGERPFSRSALARALGILLFCAAGRGGVRRQRLLREELPPELARPGQPCGNYFVEVDENGARRLGLIVVDVGQDWRRVVRRCERALGRCRQIPRLAALLAAGRFRLAIVTGDRAQRGRLRHGLKRRNFPLEPEIVVFPQVWRVAGGRGGAGAEDNQDDKDDENAGRARS